MYLNQEKKMKVVFLGVYNAQGSIVTATDQITYNRAAWLMHVIRAADDDDALRV